MLHSYLLFTLAGAMVAQSAPRDSTPEEWAREQNDQRFNREAYRGLPWEEYSKEGFFSRAPQSPVGLADSDREDALPPTHTSDDFSPTRTYAMGLKRRAPQASASSGTFNCDSGDCYTFLCKFLGLESVDVVASPAAGKS
jgi:hypothetical protein